MEPEGTSVAVKEGIEQVAGDSQDAAAAAAAPAATVAVVSAFVAEDSELARLEAQEKAEREATEKANAEAAAKATTEAAAAAGAKPDATGQQPVNGSEPAATPGSGKTRDPKDAAIIALNHKSRQLVNQVAALTGENRVLRELAADKGLKPADFVEDQPPTTEEQVAAIDEQIIALAQQYDDGKISTADWKKQELALTDQRNALRIQPVAAPAANDTVMEQHAETLATDYPILNILTVTQLEPFYGQAMAQAEAEGKPIANTNSGTMELRERMAKLATNHYMPLLTKKAAASQPTPGSSGAPATPAAPTLSATAVAREAKLELAGNHPPNISNLGAGALGGDKSEAEILADLAAFGGDDEASDRYLKAHAGVVSKVMRGVLG